MQLRAGCRFGGVFSMAVRMRDVWVRRDSSAARWARLCALYAWLLLLSGAAAHRFSLIESPVLFWAMGAAVGLSAISFMLAMIGFFDLWTNGDRAGRASATAALMSLAILVPTGLVGWMAFTTPRTAEVSTDLRDPPRFAVSRDAADRIPSGSGADTRRAANDGDFVGLHVVGRRYALPVRTVRELTLERVAEAGWTTVSAGRADFPDSESTIEAVARSLVLGLISDVAIRLTDEGATTYVDMRAAWRYGAHDLGSNARLVEAFLRDLDRAVAEEALAGVPALEEEEPE